MSAEKTRENTKVEQEKISALVLEAYEFWSQNSTNEEAAERINSAMDEAYDKGVRISVEVEQKALVSPEVVNQEIYNKFKEENPWMQDRFVINSALDNSRLSLICRGQVITTENTGFLSLEVLIGDRNENLAILKPDDIVSFTPISTTR